MSRPESRPQNPERENADARRRQLNRDMVEKGKNRPWPPLVSPTQPEHSPNNYPETRHTNPNRQLHSHTPKRLLHNK